MTRKMHKANVHGAAVGGGGLTDQMAARTRQDGVTVGGEAINSTSIFDPVLAELHYRWFCPAGGTILDPFAGGSVRGIVASVLGRTYHGIDLRPEQVDANCEQAEAIVGGGDDPLPSWTVGDSSEILADTKWGTSQYDYVFTCPPYHDLEVYSDDPRDISNMSYTDFFKVFSKTMKLAAARLRDDRFLSIVVGDVRDKAGAYRGFPAHCVGMMQGHGLKLWNEQIIVTPAGSLPGRTRHAFLASRKTGRSHQVALTFLKGDGKRAAQACGECQFGGNDPFAAMDTPDAGDDLAGLGELL